ncbi:MAG: hypothetical protein JJU46_05125 [Balneolaceae bacterium]|nr:hypothetical protein [Balneolaceae bacterium]MCH8549093.1 capsule assembly Wzi family protein [Balneolaceae bacterium]
MSAPKLTELSYAQSIPAGSVEDEQLRLRILTGEIKSVTTVNRPFSRYTYEKELQGVPGNEYAWWNRDLSGQTFELPFGFRAGVHPSLLQTTTNTRFPLSENNAAAWYGKGHNVEFTGGLYLTSRFLTIDFHPHLVYQQNRDYLIPRNLRRTSSGDPRYTSLVGTRMDAPYRFGNEPFSTLDLGHSSIRLHYRSVEAGVSNDPQTWGPARHYPLTMSHNAPGFRHAFIGTRERFRIPKFGDIQFRWMVGYPQESDYYDHSNSGRTRFTNALNLSYSPGFLRNLTIGLIRVYHMYEEDGFDWNNVTVMFDPFEQRELRDAQGRREERQQRNQTASVYFEWLLPEASARIYGEFYRGDHSWDLRDFINQPHHNGGWSLGFEKGMNISGLDMLLINTEIATLTMSQLQQVRHQAYFYGHSEITHGHTNRGQILGAAIGPGSNTQLLAIDAYRSNWKWGLLVQRLIENDNYHFRTTTRGPGQFGDYFRHRANLNLGGEVQYRTGPVMLHYRVLWTKAYNYGRFDAGNVSGITISNYERNDLTNLQVQFGVRYAF